MKIYTIKSYFYGSKEIVPFDYWDNLLSFFHTKILGQNNQYHDSTSLYSISELFNCNKNAITQKNGIIFDKGAIWLIRTPSIEVFKDFYLRSKNAIGKEMGYKLTLKDVSFNYKEFINETNLTIGASPIYLGQKDDSNERDHITYEHGRDITTPRLKKILITKANKLGYSLNENDFNIEFNLNYPIKTKLRKIGNVSNIATLGKVDITGDPTVIGLCYGLGLGISTGCGFGFVYNI